MEFDYKSKGILTMTSKQAQVLTLMQAFTNNSLYTQLVNNNNNRTYYYLAKIICDCYCCLFLA